MNDYNIGSTSDAYIQEKCGDWTSGEMSVNSASDI